MALRQPDKIKSNNPKEYGIVDAVEVSGHKMVQTLSDLYVLSDAILSPSKNNTNNDAIGQEWFVIGENSRYRLINWVNRNNKNGWKLISYGAGYFYPNGGIVMDPDAGCHAIGSYSFAAGGSTIALEDFAFCVGWSETHGGLDEINGVPLKSATDHDFYIDYFFGPSYSGALGEASCSIGNTSTAFGSGAVTLGLYNFALDNSFAAGASNYAIGSGCIAIGDRALSYGRSAVYIGSSGGDLDNFIYSRKASFRNIKEYVVTNFGDRRIYIDVICNEEVDIRKGQVVAIAQEHFMVVGQVEDFSPIPEGYNLCIYASTEANVRLEESLVEGPGNIRIFRNIASGFYSVCVGRNCIAYNENEVAIGSNNASHANTVLSFGMGEEPPRNAHSGIKDVVRKNGFEMMKDGDLFFLGLGGYDGTNPETAKSLQQIISGIIASGGSGAAAATVALTEILTNAPVVSTQVPSPSTGMPNIAYCVTDNSFYLKVGDTYYNRGYQGCDLPGTSPVQGQTYTCGNRTFIGVADGLCELFKTIEK